jgi:hypothetical protein
MFKLIRCILLPLLDARTGVLAMTTRAALKAWEDHGNEMARHGKQLLDFDPVPEDRKEKTQAYEQVAVPTEPCWPTVPLDFCASALPELLLPSLLLHTVRILPRGSHR